ncbi:MAG: cell envelope integrity protein CreD [Flavobacteriales bacterium]|nr:cell envelope integrity protein CreD [Flavobacteriales bacterium]
MTAPKQPSEKFVSWVRTSITARMLMIGILILILLIPLSYIEDLIDERMLRQQEVVKEINQKWGEEVLVYGPILKVPYKVYKETLITNPITKEFQKETTETIKFAYFFPNKLNIKSTINPNEKVRGIYKTAVYQSTIDIHGSFNQLNFAEEGIKPNAIVWEKARFIIETSNLKGVNELVSIKINNRNYAFTSKYEKNKLHQYGESFLDLHKLESQLLKIEDVPSKSTRSFSLSLKINGSKQIRFIPIGKETNVNIVSNWKTANFIGEFLPFNPDKITDGGFDAQWKILDINRPFSQKSFKGLPDLMDYAFGVNFMIPVDEYQKSERSVKYGFLVIGLTFLVFFLIQTMSKISIHPFQYLMIGVALTMFYTLLISISEHSSFLKAYFTAGIAVVSLISLYSKSILKNLKFPIFIGVSLTALYTFIFVIIQLENYALLVGSIGLFIILSSVMYASRKIDWGQE